MFPQFFLQRLFDTLAETRKYHGIDEFAIVQALQAGTDSYPTGQADRITVNATGNCREGDAA